MYSLFAFTAGLVRCLHIDRLYKLSKSVWREFCEVGVSACPLNKLFKVVYLSLLYFDFSLQIYDFNFELRLLILISSECDGLLICIYHSMNSKRNNASRCSVSDINVTHDRQTRLVNDFDK